jgi:O-methyltransferase
MKLLKETHAFFNKEYRDRRDGSFLLSLQTAFLSQIQKKYGGALPEHIYYADDCFVTYRNLGFLSDSTFASVCEKSEFDDVLYGRIWRIWVVTCSMLSAWNTRGVIADFGTYNGKALSAAIGYCTSLLGHRQGGLYAYDLFENPPAEAMKREHGPELYEAVSRRLSLLGDVQVVKGQLPQSIELESMDKIVWAQIDLNSAHADVETFKKIYPFLVKGAVVIFDDYGFLRYAETQRLLDDFLSADNRRIMELPTGQGMYIHT